MKISHSRLEKYKQCSEAYRLYAEERLTGIYINSPLFFGTAIDNAVELFLLKKKEELTERESRITSTENAYSIFDKCMREQDGVLLEKNILCDYFASDFDPGLLKLDDLALLNKQYPSITDFQATWEKINLAFKNNKAVSDSNRQLYNHMCWLSLYRKGELLLDAFEKQILPRIHRVYSIQKEIQLLNGAGDELNGKIDFIASFTDNPEAKYVCDLKTSSKAYTEDSVSRSPQLNIYCEAESIPRACYVVLEKKVRVKEPRIKTQVIRDEVYDDLREIIFDEIDEVCNNIAERKFYKKASPKECHFFGRKCEFYGVCWHKDYTKVKKRV